MIKFNDTIFYNHSQSRSITTAHNKWLPKTRSILTGWPLSSILVCLLLFWLGSELLYGCLLIYEWISWFIWKAAYIVQLYPRKCLLNARIHGHACWFTPTSCFPGVYSYHFRIPGNVFPNALPSNGPTCHNILGFGDAWKFVSWGYSDAVLSPAVKL
jgi:hypothetical protein